MNDQMQALARRAVACKHWQWMDGMKPIDPNISYMDYPRIGSLYEESSHCMNSNLCKQFDLVPDLEDDATLGCLLALVREAWEDKWLACKGEYSPTGSNWLVYSGKPHGRGFLTRVAGTRYESEAEALIAALEAAP